MTYFTSIFDEKETLDKMAEYNAVRRNMSPGDILAFSGKGFLSKAIKLATGHPCSHVAMIMPAKAYINSEYQINMIIESTSIGANKPGVQLNRLSDRIYSYSGEIWWLPLSKESKTKINYDKMLDFLLAQDGKQYDFLQAIASAEDTIMHNREDFSRIFCSELCAGGFKAGGLLKNINASEYTPKDICMEKIYAFCYQISGEPTILPDFNIGGVSA